MNHVPELCSIKLVPRRRDHGGCGQHWQDGHVNSSDLKLVVKGVVDPRDKGAHHQSRDSRVVELAKGFADVLRVAGDCVVECRGGQAGCRTGEEGEKDQFFLEAGLTDVLIQMLGRSYFC
jgi:hypothetical protein